MNSRTPPFALTLVTCLLASGCTGSRGSSGAYPPPRAIDANVAEGYQLGAPRQESSALLFLPGAVTRQLVRFDVVNGMAVMDGDILLGDPATLLLRYGRAWLAPTSGSYANTTSGSSHLWPNGVIPYAIDASVDASTQQDIAWAASHLSTTELTVRPRTSADRDYVMFRDAGGGDCSSYVGRVGGMQAIEVGGCGRGSVVHELLHAAGFFHEQSRNDRDQFVTIVWNEISAGNESNFQQNSGSQDVGTYDYNSIMHYSARAFSRSGNPTIITKVPNTPIGQRDGLSNLDRAAVSQLYRGSGGVTPPGPTPNPIPAPSNGSFAGTYSSERGDVTCSQNGSTVSCQYPGGGMLCAVQGNDLDCGWSGGGQGRARFSRQGNGVLQGTFGDMFSNNSRGAWSLVPTGSAPPAPNPTPNPTPAPGPTPAPSGTPGSLSGAFSSSRGPMTCDEKGAALTCTFNENGTSGRLDCLNDETGLRLACTWATALPRLGSGRAILTRQNISDRRLTGSWGHFAATSGGGTWNIDPQ